jgi:hypothetical protein
VLWRLIPSPRGGVAAIYQVARATDVDPMVPGGYGGFGCGGGVVRTAVSEIHSATTAPTAAVAVSCATLPVDAAFNAHGGLFVVAAGAAPLRPASQIVWVERLADGRLGGGSFGLPGAMDPHGRLVSLATTPTDLGVSQVREPPGIWLEHYGDGAPTFVPLGGESVADTGFDTFHSDVGIGVACASCHPEGGDDGRVWNFVDVGPRRTMALRGGLIGREPFHWSGDEATFDDLMHDVFSRRMSGGNISHERTAELVRWLDQAPLLPPHTALDPDAVLRGQALFESTEVGCTACHVGVHLSNDTTVNVGTGGMFQVPSLRGLAYRAPYIHDGCARTLEARFDPACGGGDIHGHTTQLSAAERTDLIAYLRTL